MTCFQKILIWVTLLNDSLVMVLKSRSRRRGASCDHCGGKLTLKHFLPVAPAAAAAMCSQNAFFQMLCIAPPCTADRWRFQVFLSDPGIPGVRSMGLFVHLQLTIDVETKPGHEQKHT